MAPRSRRAATKRSASSCGSPARTTWSWARSRPRAKACFCSPVTCSRKTLTRHRAGSPMLCPPWREPWAPSTTWPGRSAARSSANRDLRGPAAPAQAKGTAAFQTAHPERAYRESLFAGNLAGLEEGGHFELVASHRSRKMPMELMDMNAGDLDGDGTVEIGSPGPLRTAPPSLPGRPIPADRRRSPARSPALPWRYPGGPERQRSPGNLCQRQRPTRCPIRASARAGTATPEPAVQPSPFLPARHGRTG